MSIRKKITFLFLISLAVMVSLAIWTESVTAKKNEKLILSRYLFALKELLPPLADANNNLLQKKIKTLEFETVPNTPKIERIIRGHDMLFGKYAIVRSEGNYYLIIEYMDQKLILFDPIQRLFEEERTVSLLLFGADILLLMFIYLMVLKIVSPIKNVSAKMERFAKGEFSTRLEPTGDAELRQMAESFNEMAEKIEEGINERENLLKFIGHELKTPLAKARFALEKKDIAALKDSLKEIEKLTTRILELHTISNANLNPERVEIETLLVEAIKKCRIDEESQIEIDSTNFTVTADRELLSIALKNLIENGLKYSKAFPIKIVAKNRTLSVISYGEKIELKSGPFKVDQKRSRHGLGLTITETILEKHRFSLRYYHSENKNIFEVLFC